MTMKIDRSPCETKKAVADTQSTASYHTASARSGSQPLPKTLRGCLRNSTFQGVIVFVVIEVTDRLDNRTIVAKDPGVVSVTPGLQHSARY
jgi:hypothetical protein